MNDGIHSPLLASMIRAVTELSWAAGWFAAKEDEHAAHRLDTVRLDLANSLEHLAATVDHEHDDDL